MIWQSIETIPKDGSRVLVYDNDGHSVEDYCYYFILFFDEEDKVWREDCSTAYCNENQLEKDALWCSLDGPPLQYPKEFIINE